MEKRTGTVKLARSLIGRSVQLLRIARTTRSLPDMYRAIGMASDCLEDADKLICSLPDAAVLGSEKTFEELTGRKVMTAKA